MDPEIATAAEPKVRRWLPLFVAAVLVGTALLAGFLLTGHPKPTAVTAKTASMAQADAADPYAPSLPMTNVVMSESSNLAGGKVTYLDGHIANHGDRTITGITVQVIFRTYTHEVAQNETMALNLIRMREPYIDIESVSAAPLKPGAEQDFRLIFDKVTSDWDGAYPEVRLVKIESK